MCNLLPMDFVISYYELIVLVFWWWCNDWWHYQNIDAVFTTWEAVLYQNLQHEPKASDCQFWYNTDANVVDYLSNS